MPKVLFYTGTAFCLFLALTSAAEAARELRDGALAFAALPAGPNALWTIVAAFFSGLAIAGLFLRMAALLAARNLFAAFVALLAVTAATFTLAAVLFLQWRMTALGGSPIVGDGSPVVGDGSPIVGDGSPVAGIGSTLDEIHFAAIMVLGFFVSLSILSLRPYFSVQASRFLSALVFFPMPLFALIVSQEMFLRTSTAPLPASSPASRVFFAVLALLFVSIAVHSIRHRHLFLEMTNLRELLDSRVDPASRHGRPIGGVAFDS